MRKDAKVIDVGGGALFKVPTYMQGSYSVADRQEEASNNNESCRRDKIAFP